MLLLHILVYENTLEVAKHVTVNKVRTVELRSIFVNATLRS